MIIRDKDAREIEGLEWTSREWRGIEKRRIYNKTSPLKIIKGKKCKNLHSKRHRRATLV